ncbi:MAG: DUF5130 domain-containing protein [Nocardioides sp.]|nr:DUF5130 domain-containing protein [Nocardioides sp.]
MAAGELLSDADRITLDRVIRRAEQASRFEFSVYAGPAGEDDTRSFAERLHASLVAPARSVLILVDPGRRATEVVTGEDVRRYLTNSEVELALLAMQDEFAEGRICAGLVRGIPLLAEHARRS